MPRVLCAVAVTLCTQGSSSPLRHPFSAYGLAQARAAPSSLARRPHGSATRAMAAPRPASQGVVVRMGRRGVGCTTTGASPPAGRSLAPHLRPGGTLGPCVCGMCVRACVHAMRACMRVLHCALLALHAPCSPCQRTEACRRQHRRQCQPAAVAGLMLRTCMPPRHAMHGSSARWPAGLQAHAGATPSSTHAPVCLYSVPHTCAAWQFGGAARCAPSMPASTRRPTQATACTPQRLRCAWCVLWAWEAADFGPLL